MSKKTKQSNAISEHVANRTTQRRNKQPAAKQSGTKPRRSNSPNDRANNETTSNSPTERADSLAVSNSTRDRLIETARQLFLTNGYEATGIAEILRETNINSGSLYYFFKKKEDLLLAVLDRYIELLYPAVIDPVFENVHDPIERIFAVLQGYREMLTMTDCKQGCPIGNLALEMSERSEEVRKKIATNFDNWRKAIRQCLIDANDRFPADTDPDQLSTFILTVMEGAVMQARAHKSEKPFDDSVAVLRDYIERLLRK